MNGEVRIIKIDPTESDRIWAAVDMARARFPEHFAGMDDDEVLGELIRIGLKSEGVTA